jgi:amino acid adenylation domain-containing protein
MRHHISQRERETLFGFNPDPVPQQHIPVHEFICRQAERTPDAIAVRDGDTVLTYRELLDSAALIAGRLSADGIGPGSVVGLCAQRGARLVIAVLGVLLSGAAYLPVDPQHPTHRLCSMLESAQAALLLLDGTESPLPDGHPTPVRSLAGEPIGVARAGVAVDWRQYVAGLEVINGLCCVIFTSGSTGEPKGVVVTHIGLANRLAGMLGEHRVGPDDVLLQKTPCTFDVSMWELLLAFMAGGSLIVVPPQAHRDPQALVELIVRYGVTMVHFVPSMLALFVTEPEVSQCDSLRVILCGGEALPPKLVNTLIATLPHAAVYNMYGPAEATIDVTAWEARCPELGDTVPIGRPLANVTAYVVDEQGELVPLGVAGELLLGGACQARGYAGRPDLTAERFVETWVAGHKERVYRTGDLVRWSADGYLDYLGRIDTQVKIRGQRVELGEIESMLRRHPMVRDAVVALRDSRSLVAYVVPEAESQQDVLEPALRAHLAERLPEHMVPSRIVALAEIPTNPHGKADRAALPAPQRRRSGDRSQLSG